MSWIKAASAPLPLPRQPSASKTPGNIENNLYEFNAVAFHSGQER